MAYRASLCDPFKPEIIELGEIDRRDIIEKFKSIKWVEYLQQMQQAEDRDIYYSPSLEIENKENKNALSISAVGGNEAFEFYIFYKRPKLVKKLFGLFETMNENYITEIHNQTEKDSVDCLQALIDNRIHLLETKIK